MENLTSILIAVLAFAGTVIGSYFANRRSTALLNYRMEQVEKRVSELSKKMEDLKK